MPVPDNVDVCTVIGSFVNTDGRVPTGTVEFEPAPTHLAAAGSTPPSTIIGVPVTVHLDEDGAFSVDLVATDDADLDPIDWTYKVRVRLSNLAAYSFNMDAPGGTTVDLADVTPVDTSTGSPAGGGGGAAVNGLPAGGDNGEVLAKLSGTDYDADWVPASAPGAHASTHAAGSSDPVTLTQAQVTGLTAALAAKADASTTTTALAAKADDVTTISTTAPLAGGGSLGANRTFTVATFGTSAAGVVPASGGGSANYLRADGTWAVPAGTGGGGTTSGHATFTYNATTTEPPTGNQLRLNNVAQTAATRLWVSQTTTDGLDVSIGLARILDGHQVYIQDRDDASKWIKYTVTADGVDDGTYYDFAVLYHSGPGGFAAGQVELQPVAPGTIGVPPGGTTGQVLAKTSGTDFAVDWADAPVASATVDTIWTGTQTAFDALGSYDSETLYFVTA